MGVACVEDFVLGVVKYALKVNCSFSYVIETHSHKFIIAIPVRTPDGRAFVESG